MVAWHLHVDLETEQGIGDQVSAPIHRPLSPGFSPRMGSTCGRQMAPSLLELLPSGPGRLVHLPQPLHRLTPTPVLLGAFSPHTEGLGGLWGPPSREAAPNSDPNPQAPSLCLGKNPDSWRPAQRQPGYHSLPHQNVLRPQCPS